MKKREEDRPDRTKLLEIEEPRSSVIEKCAHYWEMNNTDTDIGKSNEDVEGCWYTFNRSRNEEPESEDIPNTRDEEKRDKLNCDNRVPNVTVFSVDNVKRHVIAVVLRITSHSGGKIVVSSVKTRKLYVQVKKIY